MPSTSLLIVCLVAFSALAGAQERALQSVECDPKLCEAVLNTDPEMLRPKIVPGNEELCDCTCDDEGNTLLSLSGVTEAGCIVCADLLVNGVLKCPVDVKDNDDNTPLLDAAAFCQGPMTDLFLSFGAEPNVMNDDGDSAICLAAANGQERCAGIIQSIINAGGDPCKPCGDGRLPIDVATNQVVKDIIAAGGGADCP